MAHEGVPLIVIQANSVTATSASPRSTSKRSIRRDHRTVHARHAPMTPVHSGQHDATALTAPPECFGYRRSSRKAGGAQVAGIRPSWPSSSVVTRLPAGRQPGLARRPSAASVMVQANTAEREDQRLAERWFSREAALSYASERSASSRRIQERDGRVIARSQTLVPRPEQAPQRRVETLALDARAQRAPSRGPATWRCLGPAGPSDSSRVRRGEASRSSAGF